LEAVKSSMALLDGVIARLTGWRKLQAQDSRSLVLGHLASNPKWLTGRMPVPLRETLGLVKYLHHLGLHI